MAILWLQKLFHPDTTSREAGFPVPAETGDADTQFGLGLKFATADGEAQDYPQAIQWYRKAAEQNHALAQLNLGMMYAAGQGVPRDDGAAASWFRKSAEQGDAGAQHHLAASCRRACFTGRPEDAHESKVEAYKWFHLAADQGYLGSAAACETLTLNMSREELEEGNERVAHYVAARPSPSRPGDSPGA